MFHLVFSHGDCLNGNHFNDTESFDDYEKAQKRIVELREMHFDLSYILIEGNIIEEE